MLADLEAKLANLQESLPRISGAIQVLEKEIAKSSKSTESDEKQAKSKTKETV